MRENVNDGLEGRGGRNTGKEVTKQRLVLVAGSYNILLQRCEIEILNLVKEGKKKTFLKNGYSNVTVGTGQGCGVSGKEIDGMAPAV